MVFEVNTLLSLEIDHNELLDYIRTTIFIWRFHLDLHLSVHLSKGASIKFYEALLWALTLRAL